MDFHFRQSEKHEQKRKRKKRERRVRVVLKAGEGGKFASHFNPPPATT